MEMPIAGWSFILREIALCRPLSDKRIWPAGEWIAAAVHEMNIQNLTSCAPIRARRRAI
jgi:hypothetical protein